MRPTPGLEITVSIVCSVLAGVMSTGQSAWDASVTGTFWCSWNASGCE